VLLEHNPPGRLFISRGLCGKIHRVAPERKPGPEGRNSIRIQLGIETANGREETRMTAAQALFA
jgi:hypothetical protein